MYNLKRKIFMIIFVLCIALLGSGVMVPSVKAQTDLSSPILPNMRVTLTANDSRYYSATIYAGKSLIFRAKVKNIGTVPLQVTANLTVPQNWDVDQNKFSDCPDSLAVRSSCTISWYFTPQVSGLIFLRVYVRAFYTNSAGDSKRITQSPAFIFYVKPPKGSN